MCTVWAAITCNSSITFSLALDVIAKDRSFPRRTICPVHINTGHRLAHHEIFGFCRWTILWTCCHISSHCWPIIDCTCTHRECVCHFLFQTLYGQTSLCHFLFYLLTVTWYQNTTVYYFNGARYCTLTFCQKYMSTMQ